MRNFNTSAIITIVFVHFTIIGYCQTEDNCDVNYKNVYTIIDSLDKGEKRVYKLELSDDLFYGKLNNQADKELHKHVTAIRKIYSFNEKSGGANKNILLIIYCIDSKKNAKRIYNKLKQEQRQALNISQIKLYAGQDFYLHENLIIVFDNSFHDPNFFNKVIHDFKTLLNK